MNITNLGTIFVNQTNVISLFDMHKTFEIRSLDELSVLAQNLLIDRGENRIWAFYGAMGAGKTTLIKMLCEAAGVLQQVSSPTFNLINEYESTQLGIIYHFDLYRLTSIEDALNIGAEEYFHSGNLCLLEWPENIEPLLPNNRRNVIIQVTDHGSRIIKIEDHE